MPARIESSANYPTSMQRHRFGLSPTLRADIVLNNLVGTPC